jgi:hypothetical protein
MVDDKGEIINKVEQPTEAKPIDYNDQLITVKMTMRTKNLVESAVNAYFHDAIKQLERKDLGDLERQMYEKQRDWAKEISGEIDMLWW